MLWTTIFTRDNWIVRIHSQSHRYRCVYDGLHAWKFDTWITMTMSNDKQSSYRFESAIIIKSKPSSTTTFTWTVNLNRFVRHSIHFHHIIALLIIFVICSCTLAENRASSRVVKTKYGNLRGFYTNFPNKNLQPVETFLGKSNWIFFILLFYN